jgi:uncharacterized RDD family membrane protein YckC
MNMATAPQVFPSSTPATVKAGFWIRVGAYLIDSIILFVVWLIVAGIAKVFPDWVQGIVGLLLIVSPLAYFMWMWSAQGPWPGQSLGMKALSLKVVKTDGQLLTIWMAGARVLAMAIASIPLYLGLLWVAWDPNKQGWHDKMVGTYVLKI